MKKSVNGLTFEEIFAQRGEITHFSDIKYKNVYYSTEAEGRFATIFEVLPMLNKCIMLVSTGYISKCAICIDAVFSGTDIYEATPDQIELLNAYKNESK